MAAAVGCHRNMVRKLIRRHGRRRPRLHNPLRLGLHEREEISRGLLAKESMSSIAAGSGATARRFRER